MDLRQLRYFVTIVDEKSYTRAAELLHVSQPSLSMAIKKLEKQLGLILFERNTRDMCITKEGKVLYHEAKKLLFHFEHISNEMTRMKIQGPLELSIGLIESTMFWIPKVLATYKKEHTDVRVTILEKLSLNDVIEAIQNLDIHLAITNQFIEHETIETVPIYNEKLVALLPPNHHLVQKEIIEMDDMAEESFIVCKEGFQTRNDILIAFKKSAIKPNIQFEIERFETAYNLVEAGLGITVVPENYVTHSSRNNCIIRNIYAPNISRIVYLAYDKNRYLPPLVIKFINQVQAFFNTR
ncbi:LysR family transcriptional regulator [Niallia sp. Marseille-Q9988]